MSGDQKFKDHFSSVAAKYAEFRPEYPAELFAWIASVVPGRERAWDCATGNGQAATLLSEFFEEVVATDASAGQIANARPHNRVRYAVAPAENCGLPNDSVDVITVAQAAHWLDLPKFYAEAKRVLRSEGLLAIWCYGTFQFRNKDIDWLLDDFYHNVVGPFWAPERRFIEEDYRTIDFPFDELVAPHFQMQARFTLDRLLGYLRTWSATQRFMKEKGFDPVSKLNEKLVPFWKPDDRLTPISWPIHIRAGRCSKK
jgi:ubiquinone/menaquinone biosynthesis C-methylase UbiE